MDRNPRQFQLNCNYDYDADDTIVNVYITINDKTLYTRGNITSGVPEYDQTLLIDVLDKSPDFNKNQAQISISKVNRHAFGTYKCKVDYMSTIDNKQFTVSSANAITIGRRANDSQYYCTGVCVERPQNQP
ncbi:unnamed protein product [Medioppia subpectinata]|uniref:Uncharacterized protein n=1 Tax=Medioppia subpectinata TaxID=1979941 RepID=A0A7R9KJ94_9ACAR|nr:unnamed protein product [Medioppia subpectinata]CAG2103400.1 unnamed protein product [Medioppia subpectinata]